MYAVFAFREEVGQRDNEEDWAEYRPRSKLRPPFGFHGFPLRREIKRDIICTEVIKLKPAKR